MVMSDMPRRAFLTALAAASLMPQHASAEDIIQLAWEDLLPEGSTPDIIRGIIEHNEAVPMSSEQPASTGVRSDWNGQIVRLPGFIVPIDHKGTGVTAFILVPYVGACVHVPAPPANQLVFVTTETPYENTGMFEAVYVTGMFGTASTATALADVGYALSADRIEPYAR